MYSPRELTKPQSLADSQSGGENDDSIAAPIPSSRRDRYSGSWEAAGVHFPRSMSPNQYDRMERDLAPREVIYPPVPRLGDQNDPKPNAKKITGSMIEPMQKTWGIATRRGTHPMAVARARTSRPNGPAERNATSVTKPITAAARRVLSIPSRNCAMPERTKVRT